MRRLTERQRLVLAAIERGEVKRYFPGGGEPYYGLDHQRVTTTTEALIKRKLARHPPPEIVAAVFDLRAIPVEITEAGREALQ